MGAQVYRDTVAFEPAPREEWMGDASCLYYDPEMFFPTKGDTVKKTEDAKRICNTQCTVRIKCLAKALADENGTSRRSGVFGGLSPTEREHMQLLIDNMKEREKDHDNSDEG